MTGVLPPLSQEAWQAEFAKYQQIPQYRELNRGMSLDEFKTIYWWEWSTACWRGSSARRSCCRFCFSSGAAGSSRA